MADYSHFTNSELIAEIEKLTTEYNAEIGRVKKFYRLLVTAIIRYYRQNYVYKDTGEQLRTIPDE